MKCVSLGNDFVKTLYDKDVLPKYLMSAADITYIGGFEEDILVGVAVFTNHHIQRKELFLEYIYVPKKLRRLGIAVELLQSIAKEVKEHGVLSIRTQLCDEYEELIKLYPFFAAAGFLETKSFGHMLVYKGDFYKDSSFERMSAVKSPFSDKIVSHPSFDIPAIKHFAAMSEETGFRLHSEDLDENLCKFYIEEGEVRAAICLKEVQGGNMITLGSYFSPELKNKEVVPFLMSEFLKNIKGLLALDSHLYVRTYRKKLYQAMLNTFKAPEKDYEIIDMIMEL